MDKMKVLLIFPKNLTGEPITYILVREYDLRINILKAHVDYNIRGSLLMELEGTPENLRRGVSFLSEQGISVVENGTATSIDLDRCVACGACTAACETGALRIGTDDLLHYDSEKCLECMLCVKACPQRIITDIFA